MKFPQYFGGCNLHHNRNPLFYPASDYVPSNYSLENSKKKNSQILV